MLTIEQRIKELISAGMEAHIVIKDATSKGFTVNQMCLKWGVSVSFLKKILKEKDCRLEVKQMGKKGRGRATIYYGHSVLEEEKRLRENKRIK